MEQPIQPKTIKKTNYFAIASLVTAVICPPVGLVMSIISLIMVKKQGGEGRGLSVAGIVISSSIMVLYVLSLVLFALVFFGIWAAAGS